MKLSPTDAPPTSPAPTGLSEYDSTSPLVVKGRDRLRVCVQTLSNSVQAEDAAEAIEAHLLAASDDSRWRDEFGTPSVDVGCPLPPVALQGMEAVCTQAAGPYLVYSFVGNASLFRDRFPESVVALSDPPGIRRADEERIEKVAGASDCAYLVAEAWYLTPDDLNNSTLLEAYMFGIFTIAELCC